MMIKNYILLITLFLFSCVTSVYGASTDSCFDTDTKFLLHMDGTDESTTFTDSSDSSHSVTAYGDAQIDTARSVFGGASGLFDGSGDYLTAPDNDDWSFGSGDFTIEMNIYLTGTWSEVTWPLVQHYDGGGDQREWQLQLRQTGTYDAIRLIYSTEGSDALIAKATWTPSMNTWYHIAVIRNGDDLKFFVDGTQVGSTVDFTGVTLYEDSTSLLYVNSVTPVSIDELRIVKGTAIWTSNFTPPTSAYSSCTSRRIMSLF